MGRVLPTPTPQDIEAALTTMRDGSHNSLENGRKANAEASRLWWVTIMEPDDEEGFVLGGGTTLAEAAAVAWINSCIGFSWSKSGLSDEDDAKVPRRVPDGWQFELHARPVRPVLTIIEGSRPAGAE